MAEKTRRILYLQYTNPTAYPPLEHSSRILADAGWEVLFLGIGSHGADSISFQPHDRIRVRQLAAYQTGWKQKANFLYFCLWAVVWTLRWRPSWVYASDLLSCPGAALLAGVLQRQLIYHEHDWPSQIDSGGPISRFLRLCLMARRYCAFQAAACVIPNAERAALFAKSVKPQAPMHIVWNCPSLHEASQPKPEDTDDRIWAFYHGSIGPERLPMSIVDALASLPGNMCLRVAGYETIGSIGYLDQFWKYARSRGVESRLERLGTIPQRSELFALCRSSHVGLALVPGKKGDFNLKTLTGASNKAFDYLACGLPLVVADQPDWQDFYCKPGFAIACEPGEAASLAAALRWYQEHPQEMRSIGERGRQRVLSEWNYEGQFQPVLDILNSTAEGLSFTPKPARTEF